MYKPIGITAALLAAAGFLVRSRARARRRRVRARTRRLAWDKGDYVTALTAYHELLNGPDRAAVLEPIALRTGELFNRRSSRPTARRRPSLPTAATSRSRPDPASPPASRQARCA